MHFALIHCCLLCMPVKTALDCLVNGFYFEAECDLVLLTVSSLMSPDCDILLCSSVHYVVICSKQLLHAAILVLQASYCATSIINPRYDNRIKKKKMHELL